MPAHERDLVDDDDACSSDASSTRSNANPATECEDDRCNGPHLPIWHCVDCDSSYCTDCWPRQGPHKPKKKGRDGVPHEKTNPHVVRRLKGILNPSKDPHEIQRLHEEDESTKWFGVAKDLQGRPNFEDYGRYATLMSSISPVDTNLNRYPQLVSFIGVTNAGKSTLINMLINHDAELAAEKRVHFPSPIVGSVVNDTVPTSGDVHLYADPATHAEQLPILYADCEGFEGGERMPLGAKARKRKSDAAHTDSPDVYTRPIEWAVSEEERQREYTVTALYPRLLYTFSDCVVFVLRNPKTFQSAVLTKLLDWGVAALERSLNQPALPHCIVALNGTDPGVDEKEWDINFATQSLLASVKDALDYVEGVPRFRELAEHWRALGKHIYSVEDLILRYYSSFKVVRIPAKPRYMTIHEQITKLHTTIKNNCNDSFRAKRRARMLTNADELNVYLQSGFDHFTTHLNVPFNFMAISLQRNPIKNDFGGHILQLCTTISSRQPNHQPGRVAWMFEKLSVMLASCVLLDCARFRKGRVDQLFSNYEKFFDYAMGEYLELHYPCSYVSPDGTRQCQLVRARHAPKGHQDDAGIIAAGDYEAAFDASFPQQWKAQLRAAIEGIHRDFSYELEQATNFESQAIPEERIALDLHIEYLNQFFEAIGPAGSIISHATCFCCLMDVPEHPLPCGHVLCTACIKAYGKGGKSSVALTCCPLHRESTQWARPAQVRFKPNGAGVRILSLDGGGIRGIVQLEVLRAIENAIGGYIPIQSFFDLCVGSGTGGLISVALAMKDRNTNFSIDTFKAICEHAFTPRVKAPPLLDKIVQVFSSGPKYKTKPLYQALKTTFTEEDDLFGCSDNLRPGSRVGLVSTSVTGRDSILLASYRRPEDFMPAYSFERPHEPEMELKIWQSVAASMAAPNFFRPFQFFSKTYLDGGLRCTNPAYIADRERRLIWSDVGEPDLFLSLGTGQNRISVLQKLSDRPRDQHGSIMPEPGQTAAEAGKRSRWRSLGVRRADDVLEAEIAWADFRNYAVREKTETKGRRFIRFNPDLDKDPPAPDSKGELESLQANVRKRLQTAHRLAALRNVAHRLVASSFYFELQSKNTADKNEQLCSGVITCRFDDGSLEMMGLGKILDETRTDDGFEPYFLVKPDAVQGDFMFKIPITTDVIRGMTHNAVFGLPNVYVPLRDEAKSTNIALFLSANDGLEPDGFSISGFPRVLLGDPAASAAQRPRTQRSNSDTTMRSMDVRRATKTDVMGDDVSVNGRVPPSSRGSIDTRSETQSRMSSAMSSKFGPPSAAAQNMGMSLSDLIAHHQSSANSSRTRTNRFWTYIGNNHMVQHPELYSPEELAKFANTSENGDGPGQGMPAGLAAQGQNSPDGQPDSHSTPSGSTASVHGPQIHELDASDRAMELREQRALAAPRKPVAAHPSSRAQSPEVDPATFVPSVRTSSLPQPRQHIAMQSLNGQPDTETSRRSVETHSSSATSGKVVSPASSQSGFQSPQQLSPALQQHGRPTSQPPVKPLPSPPIERPAYSGRQSQQSNHIISQMAGLDTQRNTPTPSSGHRISSTVASMQHSRDTSRDNIPSTVETEFDEDRSDDFADGASTDSGAEVKVAQTSSLVQLPSTRYTGHERSSHNNKRHVQSPQQSSLEHSPHVSGQAFQTALPDQKSYSSVQALDKWLSQQKNTSPNVGGLFSRKSKKGLNSVEEQAEE